MNRAALLYVGIGAAVLAALYVLTRPGVAFAAGKSVATAAGNAAAGVVEGIGAQVGIPATNETECDKALREGRLWDASFACPASRFVSEGLLGRTAGVSAPDPVQEKLTAAANAYGAATEGHYVG